MPQSPPRLARSGARLVRSGSARALIRRARVQRHLDRASGNVALTFDDGPDPEHTPAVLDELGRLGIVATFFLVGHRATAHPGIVRRIIDEGHAVGSHSNSHPEPWGIPMPDLVREYRRGRVQVERAARRPVPLFRPPKGYVDGRGAAAMLAARLRPWLWTIDPHDWVPGVRPAEILAGLADLGSGDVVLLHDAIQGPLDPSALDRSATVAALDAVGALARQRQLRFCTLAGARR
ncbi:MAG: polysaccharide deacetylase family protein [Acidimicrobiales bacterium]